MKLSFLPKYILYMETLPCVFSRLDFSSGKLDDTMYVQSGQVSGAVSLVGQNICPGGSVYFRILPVGVTGNAFSTYLIRVVVTLSFYRQLLHQ
jgi:hypothetical protein